MAALTALPAMHGDQTLHPFFSKTNPLRDGPDALPTNGASTTGEEPATSACEGSKKGRPSTRSAKPTKPASQKTQRTIEDVVNQDANAAGSIPAASPLPNVDRETEVLESSPRRKRRRTSLVDFIALPDDDPLLLTGTASRRDDAPARAASPQVLIPASSPLHTKFAQRENAAKKTPPKKMLRLNASGRFSSPTSTTMQKEQSEELLKRRGRPRKSKEPTQDRSVVVVIRYTSNSGGIGPRIDRILSGEERHGDFGNCQTQNKQHVPRKVQSLKSTHPFFVTKPKTSTPKQESPRKTSAVTPGKLRRQTMDARLPAGQIARQTPDYVIGSALLKDRLMFKHPGAKDSAWPSKEQFHVRGFDEAEIDEMVALAPISTPVFGTRKRKAARVPFPPDQSLLRQISERLRPEDAGKLRADGFREPHPALTLPRKLLIPGHEIAHRISHELSVSGKGEPASPPPPKQELHLASQRVYDSIAANLSAFDEGRGETWAWTQKYEPTTAADVLQPAREMTVLRKWLTSLTVTSVEFLAKPDTRIQTRLHSDRKKRRRRKATEMDDFLVSDDEDEIHEIGELVDTDDSIVTSAEHQNAAKSVVRVASAGIKVSNAVLLSGPPGCGKTTAAHAVAKELGFKIFDISPCERRAGKDVLDKVGDMTENHLVKHHGTDVGVPPISEEPNRMDEAFQRDLVSGRQGKMNAFFQPKEKSKAPSVSKLAQRKVIDAVRTLVKKPPKDQQQSLILLEEVDLLFKDDKDFWNTIFRLIESSKRPFIMTCNDEDLVPLQAMSLHAILRFHAPPADLAVDYLLLLAANEGHLLKRNAVVSLYHSKGQDLRASIVELDFWCQMGVGDPRGGLAWIYQRYPPGCDVDADGRKLRVVSEGTYEPNMTASLDSSLSDEAQLLWAQREYGVDVANTLGWHDVHNDFYASSASLKSICSMSDALSAADTYAGMSNSYWQDLTQPPMGDKARSQYIEGMKLLQTDQYIDNSDLTSQLAITTTLAALRTVHQFHPGTVQCRVEESVIKQQQRAGTERLTRHAFACFDAISVPSDSTTLFANPGQFMQSAFDGPLSIIATDLAPYVRSIVQHDSARAEQRERLSSIMTDGGRNAKRVRTTRAARSALEGGQRSSTRRERWFTKELNVDSVLATGGREWPRVGIIGAALTDGDGEIGSWRDTESTTSTPAESQSASKGPELL